jgi:hypothetical protein
VNVSTLRLGSDSSRLDIEVVQRQERVAWVLRLTLKDGPQLAATVEGAYLIPEAHEADGLVGFFEDMAEQHWTGWSGAKSWASLEHNLAIEAKWHRTGGATLLVTLMPEGQRWKVQGTIEVDDMALERLGRRARVVFLDGTT